MKHFKKWIVVAFGGILCGTLGVVGYRLEVQRETFCRELRARNAQLRAEVVEWAQEQVARRVGPTWGQTWSSDNIWLDEVDQELERALDALCTWARTQASTDECERILEQEKSYPAIKEVDSLLGVLKMTVRFPGDFSDHLAQRQFFDEIDAEIQELIHI